MDKTVRTSGCTPTSTKRRPLSFNLRLSMTSVPRPMLGTYLTAVKSNNIGSLGSCAAADRTSRCTSWHAASSNALQCTTAQTTSACGSIETAGFSGMVFLVMLTTFFSDQLSNLQNA